MEEASSGRVPLLISLTKRHLKGGSAGCWFTLLTRTICWHPGMNRAAPRGRRSLTQVRLVLLESQAERALLAGCVGTYKDYFSWYVVICDVKKCKKWRNKTGVKAQNAWSTNFFFFYCNINHFFFPKLKPFLFGSQEITHFYYILWEKCRKV